MLVAYVTEGIHKSASLVIIRQILLAMTRPQPFSSGPLPYSSPRITLFVFRFLRQFPLAICSSEKDQHLVSFHEGFAESLFRNTEIA